MKKEKIWREDITALRAIAVIPVVLFHIWPELIPGGFIGVDIFFVVSGYLISGIIFRNLAAENRINYLVFYRNRIRRILPNLLALLVFVAFFIYFLCVGSEVSDYFKSVKYSAFFAQNIHLMRNATDYFGVDASHDPLLHLWSLAIEEQFYLIFPLVCFAAWRFGKDRLLGWVVLLFFVASLGYCIAYPFLYEHPEVAYFNPAARFWEILAGSLLAYVEVFKGYSYNNIDESIRNFGSFAAFILLAASYVLIDAEKFQFPGVISIIPIFGAVLFILVGPKASFNRLVSNRFLIFVGLISYSLYLWHWPLIKLIEFLEVTESHVQLSTGLSVIALSILISTGVYKYIENPARLHSNYRSSVVFLVTLIAVGMVGQMGYKNSNDVIDHQIFPIQKASRINKYDWNYPGDLIRVKDSNGVEYMSNNPKAIPSVLLIGDSHMEQYANKIADIASRKGITIAVIVHGGCFISPLLDSEAKTTCRNTSKNFVKFMENYSPDRVIHAQKWDSYVLDERTDVLSIKAASLNETASIAKKKESKYLIVLDNPNSKFVSSIPINGRITNLLTLKDWKYFDAAKENSWLLANNTVKKIVGTNAIYFEVASKICPDMKCNKTFFKDGNHLRYSYVKNNLEWLSELL